MIFSMVYRLEHSLQHVNIYDNKTTVCAHLLEVVLSQLQRIHVTCILITYRLRLFSVRVGVNEQVPRQSLSKCVYRVS